MEPIEDQTLRGVILLEKTFAKGTVKLVWSSEEIPFYGEFITVLQLGDLKHQMWPPFPIGEQSLIEALGNFEHAVRQLTEDEKELLCVKAELSTELLGAIMSLNTTTSENGE